MSIGDKGICVRILEKEYRVACAKEQEAALLAAADYLDKQMRIIQQTGRVMGLDRMAMMAALNISNDLLKLREEYKLSEHAFLERLKALQDKIDNALLPESKSDISDEVDTFLDALECAEEI